MTARRELVRVGAPLGALVLLGFAALPPGLAGLVAVPLVVGAVLEVRRVRALVRDLREVEAYAAVTVVEEGEGGAALEILVPDEAPRVRSREARALVRRIEDAAARARLALAEQQARADAELRSEAVRARFTAAMGHELKTPLTSIVGFAAMLERRPAGELGPAQRESVVMIRRAAQELLRLLGDLLDSAKLDAGRLVLAPGLVPAVEVLTQAAAEARDVVEGRSLAIEASFQPGLPPLRVDRARLVQAIVAVFRHVARGLDRGTLVLAARRGEGPQGRSELHVEIRGPQRALSPGEQDRLFDAFHSARTAGGGRAGGLGLALSLARRLVRRSGGEVTALTDEAEGTRFVVSIPIDE